MKISKIFPLLFFTQVVFALQNHNTVNRSDSTNTDRLDMSQKKIFSDSINALLKEIKGIKQHDSIVRNEDKNVQGNMISSKELGQTGKNQTFSLSVFSQIFLFCLLLTALAIIFVLKRRLKKYITLSGISNLDDEQNAKVNIKVETGLGELFYTDEKQPELDNQKKYSEELYDNSDTCKWYIVGASVIGKSHIANNTTCQDNHYWEDWDKGWGIAIVCDGAGSAENSQMGSAFLAKKAAPQLFKQSHITHEWPTKNYLPTENEWHIIVKENVRKLQDDLKTFANEQRVSFSSVACTLIVVIYSPWGLLTGHVGDGRAGYCDELGEWKSVMKPHKGEEANQTIFMSSNLHLADPAFVMSGIKVPETRVVNGKVAAFTLMSDGCETHSFQCSILDRKTDKWHDPNIPYPKFFNPLISNLTSLYDDKVSTNEANEKWKKFIESGTNGFKNEPDDKTMILAISIKS